MGEGKRELGSHISGHSERHVFLPNRRPPFPPAQATGAQMHGVQGFDFDVDGRALHSLISYCTIKCWMERAGGGADEVQVAETMLAIEFHGSTDAACLTCSIALSSSDEENGHVDHDWLPIIMESGRRPRVQIGSEHRLAKVWWNIKGSAPGGTGDFLIKDDSSPRCQRCQLRLVDGGGKTCSLECCLPQPKLLPRPIQLQQLDS